MFSDGTPFTADDVVFTFQALYDPKAEGPLASSLRVNGQPLAVRKVDAHTVVLTLPAPYGPGLRLLNGLPILPAHKLRDALAKGEFAKAWSTATPPAEITGLGPYRAPLLHAGRAHRAGPQPALRSTRARRPALRSSA